VTADPSGAPGDAPQPAPPGLPIALAFRSRDGVPGVAFAFSTLQAMQAGGVVAISSRYDAALVVIDKDPAPGMPRMRVATWCGARPKPEPPQPTWWMASALPDNMWLFVDETRMPDGMSMSGMLKFLRLHLGGAPLPDELRAAEQHPPAGPDTPPHPDITPSTLPPHTMRWTSAAA
jgi:hypothetical protein